MGKLGCPCGWVLSNIAFPCNDQGMAFEEADIVNDNFSKGRGLWECPKCGSIAVDKVKGGNEVIWYHPENKKCNHVVSTSEWNFDDD